MASPQKFVFICGLHRSGTSLLHRMLKAHPAISGFSNTGAPEDEGQHLQDVYPTARSYGGPGKFCFAAEACLREDSPLVTRENSDRLMTQWGKYWDMQKPILLEKSPPNIIRSRFLQAMFPESYFIFLVRHPVAVSFATQKWAQSDITELMDHWRRAHRIMAEDVPNLMHHMTLRYEDLIAQPERHLATICRFLDIEPAICTEALSEAHNANYFSSWESYRISDKEKAKACMPFFDHARRFGYRFDAPYVMPL